MEICPTVIPLRPEEVPKEFVCAICLSIPLNPLIIRQCSHVFCENCIEEYLDHQIEVIQDETCPVCRCQFACTDLSPLEKESTLAHRIWAGIGVKCEHHAEGCGWTGSLSDYKSHARSCPKKTRNQQTDTDRGTIDSLEEEINRLKVTQEEMEVTKEDLEMECNLLKSENQELRQARDTTLDWKNRFAKEFQDLKELVENSIEIPMLNGRGGYDYDRTSVPRLTKLICQNLCDRPESINANKLFECVDNICSDLRKEYSDNPKYLYIDVRMLLGVCQASTWFTTNQQVRLNELAEENGYSLPP